MKTYFDHYWKGVRTRRALKAAIILSIAIHIGAAFAFMRTLQATPRKAIPIGYEVQIIGSPSPDAVAEAVPEPPKPEPPKQEPKPEPPKPDPPKPEPEQVAKVEPKPEPPKKEEPKKELPKKEPEKPKPIETAKKPPDPKPAEKQPEAKPKEPSKPTTEVAKASPKKTGVSMQQALPSALSYWGRLVQRKVEKNWEIPGGLRIADDANEAIVAFWVDKNGNLLGRPEIIKQASDPELGESGIRAIIASAPLPPLPVEYKEVEQQVQYVFSLAKE